VSDLVVVPTPLRKSRFERRLCDAQDGVLLGPRVATLRNLVPGFLAAAGERRNLLEPLAERLLALRAASDSGLIGEVARSDGGAARGAARLLAEARAGEVGPADLLAAARTVQGRVAERLEAAARALALYEERLDGLGALDAAGALRGAADAAARGAVSEETRDLGLLVLEGFLPTTRAALDLGGALAARARRVLARVPAFPEDLRRSGPVEPWLRRVESLHELAAQRDIRVEFPATGAVARERVIRLPAPDDAGQGDAAARLVATWLDGGIPPDEVAVFAPGRILETLPAAFARLGVPLAVSLSRPLAGHPLVRDLRSAVRGAGALDRTAVETLLSSPYLGPPEGAARQRFLLDRAGVLDGRGDPEERLRARAALLGGSGKAAAERVALTRMADAVRDLRRLLAPLAVPGTPVEWAARVRALLERAGVRRRAARGVPSLARRDLAAIARLEEVLEDLASALDATGAGSRRMPREEFASLLELAAGLADLPSGQGPASGAVEAWPTDEAPGLVARAAVVLGAERGSWPGAPRVDALLGNSAREALDAHLRRRAMPTAFHLRADAEFRGWSALAAARETLAVGWTEGPDREGPAPLAAQALDLAGAEELRLGRDPALEAARGPAEALRAAARLSAAGHGPRVVAALEALPDLARRAADAGVRGWMEVDRRSAWVAGEATPAAGAIPPGLPPFAAALPAEWSATDLETFAGCPYRFLLRAARVPEAERGSFDMEPRDEGAMLHAILEAFVGARRDRGAWPLTGSDADREEVRRLAGEVLQRFEAEGRVGDPSTWAGRRAAILARLDRFVEVEARDADGMRPVLLEYAFGGRSGRPAIAIPSAGDPVLLQGRIDRVDDDGRRLLVVDYKNSRSTEMARERLSEEELGRSSFQAPVYLLAAARELPGRAELSATYSLLRSGERAEPWRVDSADPFLALDPERRAAIRAAGGRTLADGVVEIVSRIRSGRFPVAPSDCTGCPFGAVCRFPRPGEA
jgi:hypothetical protein